ncbi:MULTISPECIES: cysteine hydrolase family protein [Gordonia]|uniref:Cysteine hydrolase n=1 Tax=Gordonia hongkongensis TaxID=1701090 RepID=A0ABT6BXD3_9ACTN|nr:MULTISPECIES: cysteine hydrolase [Gordonia]MCT1351975.1 cysteine hydrolase [Gordonia sp. p3-SID1431]MDF6102375.1 cysteine hydrolase [Gordonia hongkongensis]OCH79188.1 isochorismatase [Gordonia sp. UCD-TK1]UPG67775.1 cysteine hydrolase [Gordonia hongkongensis]WGJ85089.1 cysteine hydrolase [Gordonia sp. SMJS1]
MTPYSSPALVISECQQGLLDPPPGLFSGLAEQASVRGLVRNTAELARAFRARSLPVVHCTIAHRSDQMGMLPNSYLSKLAIRGRMMVEGSPDIVIPADLGPEPTDLVSSRATGLTAFYGTNLDAMLRLQRVQTLVLAGISTDVALPGLALEGVNRGYDVVLAEDCTAGTSAESHDYMVTNMLAMLTRITPAADVIRRLPG